MFRVHNRHHKLFENSFSALPTHPCSSLLRLTPAVLHSPLILFPAHSSALPCSPLLFSAHPSSPPLTSTPPRSPLLFLAHPVYHCSSSLTLPTHSCSSLLKCSPMFTSLTLALHSPTNWSYTVFIRLYHISVKAKCSSLCNVSF